MISLGGFFIEYLMKTDIIQIHKMYNQIVQVDNMQKIK
jgi:hypothetical protein